MSRDRARSGRLAAPESACGRRHSSFGRRGATLVTLALFATSCQVTQSNLASLAAEPPAPYSVAVTGGAFLDRSPRGSTELSRTFGASPDGEAEGPMEAIPLPTIAAALGAARVFARVSLDPSDVSVRRLLVDQVDGVRADGSLPDTLRRAALDGHDYVLSIQRLADAPVHEFGINGRWPITAVAWLLLGIGLVIPDHTFESGAELHVALLDVHSGAVVYERVFDGDPVDLALIDRTDFWGLLLSIVVPPFWVGNHDAAVVSEVRAATSSRLLFVLAQDLKSVGCRNDLRSRAPATIEFERDGDLLRCRVQAGEGLSFARVRVDGAAPIDEGDSFARALLDSARFELAAHGGTSVHYVADMAMPARGRYLQLIVQTIGGRVASSTLDLREREAGGDSTWGGGE